MTGAERYFSEQQSDPTYRRWYRIYRLIRSGPAALFMLWMFLALSVMDCATTVWLVSRGATELNPIMAWVGGHGVIHFWLIKMGFAIFASVMLEAAYLTRRIVGFRVIAGVVAFQWVVVLINTIGIARLS